MITGAHAFSYGRGGDDLRDLLGFTPEARAENEERDWPAFVLPPVEVTAHPAGVDTRFALYLFCDDIEATVVELKSRGVRFSRDVTDEGWGLITAISLPDGGQLRLFQPMSHAERPEDHAEKPEDRVERPDDHAERPEHRVEKPEDRAPD